MSFSMTSQIKQPKRSKPKAASRPTRLSGLQGKLIIPYVLLTLILAGIGVYVITRLVSVSVKERLVNQLQESSKVAADGVARQENANLANLRQAIFIDGVGDAVLIGDANALYDLLYPVALNNQVDVLTTFDALGREIISLRSDKAAPDIYQRSTGTDLATNTLIMQVLAAAPDALGDKYAEIQDTAYGPMLFTAAPVQVESGARVGGMMVGRYLDEFVFELKQQAQADIVIFDLYRNVIVTSFPRAEENIPQIETLTQSLPEDNLHEPHDITLGEDEYQIVYSPLVARAQALGWTGVILTREFVTAAESTSRDTFSIMFTIGTMSMIVIGFILSRNIALPILKLRNLTQAVAAGDLNQHIGLNRSDEIGDLAQAFDQMTISLRERTAEAARLYAEALRTNKELQETYNRLKAAQMQLIQSEKLAAIGQLTAGIVHDIKNPLAVIKGMAEMMMSGDSLPAELHEEVTLIRESAQKANNIVSDLMKFSRQSTPELHERDMRETVLAALRLTAYPTRKANVQVIQDIPDEPIPMVFDDQQIEQVLVNLITNAVQAMPGGGTLRVNLSQSDGVAAVAVQDTGSGISPENLSRIFDPFFTTKPEGEGTGLGLSVSYGIISNHSGRIEVESQVGQGTTFTVLLPMYQPEVG